MQSKRNIDQAINIAFQRGGSRPKETFHILVHPAYPWGKVGQTINKKFPEHEVLITKWLEDYYLEINEIMGRHPGQTAMIRESESELHQIFPKASLDIQGHPSDVGFLTPGGMEELLAWMGGINKSDEIIIHGSGWLYCPEQFAFQWTALQTLGIYVPYREPIVNSRNGIVRGYSPDPEEQKIRDKLKGLMSHRECFIFEGVQHNTSYNSGTRSSDFAQADVRSIIPTPEEVKSLM